jgi:hypothetical protein
MSLTQEEMDWLDEQPTIRNFPAVLSFTETRAPSERRSRVAKRPAWRIAADARQRLLELLAYLIEKDDRDAAS